MTKPQCGKRHHHEHDASSTKGTERGTSPWLLGSILCSVLFSGCVSVEKYESEKTRALNFQRLLAQEENRAGELNAQLQKAKIEIASLESQNEELSVKLDSVRGQVRHRQTSGSTSAMPGSVGESGDMSFSETSLSEFGLPDLSFDESEIPVFDGEPTGEPVYHTVKAKETLYRLSRTYGVTIAQLKEWNSLTSDLISIGQRLIVSSP